MSDDGLITFDCDEPAAHVLTTVVWIIFAVVGRILWKGLRQQPIR